MFGAPAPTLNIRGESIVKTTIGAFWSLAILSMTFMFGLLKLQHLATGKNPTLTTNMSILEPGVKFNTASEDFMMAFAATEAIVFNYKIGPPKSDTRYVKW